MSESDRQELEMDGRPSTTERFLGMLLALGGSFFLVVALMLARRPLHLVTIGKHAEARVSQLRRDDSGMYSPVLLFKDANGDVHEHPSGLSSNSLRVRKGDMVPVLYDPDDPRYVEIDSFEFLWLGSLMFSFVGMGVAGMGLWAGGFVNVRVLSSVRRRPGGFRLGRFFFRRGE